MIRDPSDGSVKEDLGTMTSGANGAVTTGDHKIPLPHESGLREPSGKSDYLARLNRSREWLAKRKSEASGLLDHQSADN